MSTEVPSMGLQSWPVHNGGDDAEPTMAEEIWIFGALCLYWCDVELHI